MTVRTIKIKGEKFSFLAHADSAEQLITGATTGATGTAGIFKVKDTYLYWIDDDGNERRKQGTVTGATGTPGVIKVKGEDTYYIDDDGDERYVRSTVIATYYPDADPETTSVDGAVGHLEDLTWANLIAGAGTIAHPIATGHYLAGWLTDTVTDKYARLYRSIFLFDTSALPDGCTIISATLSLFPYLKANEGSWANVKFNIYSSAPAEDKQLVAGDFDSLGNTAYCDTDVAYGDITIALPRVAIDFVFNATGLAAISKTGITKIGFREVTYDVGGLAPTWASNKSLLVYGYFAEIGAIAPAYRPKLVIVYE